jgi:hypothetical protein
MKIMVSKDEEGLIWSRKSYLSGMPSQWPCVPQRIPCRSSSVETAAGRQAVVETSWESEHVTSPLLQAVPCEHLYHKLCWMRHETSVLSAGPTT